MTGESTPDVAAPHERAPDRSPRRSAASRAGMILVVIGVLITKAVAYASILHHPMTVFFLFGFTAAVALRHGRLIWTAISGGVIVPVALSPASVGVGIAVGVVTFVALMTLFVAIGTLLNAVDTRASQRRRARAMRSGPGPAAVIVSGR